MPYLDASPRDLQLAYAVSDRDLPDAAILVGRLWARPYLDAVRRTWPETRDVDERTVLVETAGLRTWIVVVIGAAAAATYAHTAVKLGARALVQLGSMGGLADEGAVGDVLVPSSIVGRDGVSRQLSRNKPLAPDAPLSAALCAAIAPRIAPATVRSGVLVTTTTISFERQSDVARWRRAGYAGVEMEAAATAAVAGHFGVPFTSAFVLMDNLAVGHTVFAQSDDDKRRIAAAQRALLVSALDVVTGFETTGTAR